MNQAVPESPHMSPDELSLFRSTLSSEVWGYLEFGIGGSTIMAARLEVPEIVGVDSHQGWVASIRSHPDMQPRVEAHTASILHADIGPVGDWGAPKHTQNAMKWPNYIRTGWDGWASRNPDRLPDIVLVDGRFRVACCLSALVFASLHGGRPEDVRVLLHDVVPERPQYKAAITRFDVVQSSGTLRLLRGSRRIRMTEVFSEMLGSQFDGY